MSKESKLGTVAVNDLNRFRTIRKRVLNDPEISEILDEEKCRSKVIQELNRSERRIIRNLGRVKGKGIEDYQRLVECELENIDSTIAHFSTIDDSSLPINRPILLCKYMPKSHAVENILNGVAKYGSVSEYRYDDEMECTLPIAPESNYDSLIDAIQANIIREALADYGVDIESIYGDFQNYIGDNCFIGCFSDGSDAEYMWGQYAKTDGVCVWFEADYSELRRIVYADYLEKAVNLRKRYQELMLRIATAKDDSIFDDLKSLTKEFIGLSIMSFYTKGPQYARETEWRVVVPCHDPDDVKKDDDGLNFIIRPIPGSIKMIETRMPQSYNEELLNGIAKNIKIVFEDAKGPGM